MKDCRHYIGNEDGICLQSKEWSLFFSRNIARRIKKQYSVALTKKQKFLLDVIIQFISEKGKGDGDIPKYMSKIASGKKGVES